MKKKITKKSLKAIIAGVVAIIVFGGVFILANKAMFLSSTNKTEIIPTNYAEVASVIEGDVSYQKADYSIVKNKVLPCTNVNAISAEVAAEAGAQYLWDMFKADLDGKQIYMGYQVDPQRAIGYWHGEVYKNGVEINRSNDESLMEYSFDIEAISGMRCSAYHNVKVDKTMETKSYNEYEANKYYKDNCEEFLSLANDYAKKQNPFEPVKTEFDGTASTMAPDYAFYLLNESIPTGDSSDSGSNTGIITPQGTFELSHDIIRFMVTGKNDNVLRVSIDITSKELICIEEIFIQ